MDETLLPAPLRQLLDQYDRTVDEYDKNHLTHDQAFATIEALSCFDGAGNRWTVDANRQFCIQDGGVGAAVVSSADMWVDEVSGSSPRELARLQSEQDEYSRPPARERGDNTRSRVARRRRFDFRRHRYTIAAVVVFAVLLGGFALFGGSDDQNNGSGPQLNTTVPSTAPLTTTAPVQPVDVEADVPTGDQIAALVVELTSGDSDRTRAALMDSGTKSTAAFARSFWSGTTSAGVTIDVSSTLGSSDGTVVHKWTLVDVDGVTVGVADVAYVRRDGAWTIMSWPTVTATS